MGRVIEFGVYLFLSKIELTSFPHQLPQLAPIPFSLPFSSNSKTCHFSTPSPFPTQLTSLAAALYSLYIWTAREMLVGGNISPDLLSTQLDLIKVASKGTATIPHVGVRQAGLIFPSLIHPWYRPLSSGEAPSLYQLVTKTLNRGPISTRSREKRCRNWLQGDPLGSLVLGLIAFATNPPDNGSAMESSSRG